MGLNYISKLLASAFIKERHFPRIRVIPPLSGQFQLQDTSTHSLQIGHVNTTQLLANCSE